MHLQAVMERVWRCNGRPWLSECIFEFIWCWTPSGYLSSLDLGHQAHLWTGSITTSKYIVNARRRVYGDTGVTEVDWLMGSADSGDPAVDRHHLIFISSGSTQLRGFSQLGRIISSHFLPRLLVLERFILTKSIWMSREALWNVDGGLTAVDVYI